MIAAARRGIVASSDAANRDRKLPPIPKSTLSPSHAKVSLPLEPPRHPKSWLDNLRRPRTSPGPKPSPLVARSQLSDDDRRDSALLPASPATTIHSTNPEPAVQELSRVSSLPTIVVHGSASQDEEVIRDEKRESDQQPRVNPQPDFDAFAEFSGITTTIPTGSFEALSSPDKLSFSKRGSMLVDGKRAALFADTQTPPSIVGQLRPEPCRRLTPSIREGRVLSVDERDLSQKVRSMYEYGNERGTERQEVSLTDQTLVEEEDDCETPNPAASTLSVDKVRSDRGGGDVPRSPSFNNRRESIIQREPFERAGGIEDWEDVQGGEVDRYGFIIPQKTGSRASNQSGVGCDSPTLQRVSTVLVDASETLRRKRTIRRTPSRARHSQATPQRRASKRSNQPNGSIHSYRSTGSFAAQSPLRFATNRLPQNKERRWMDEASDMLTLPPGLADIAAQEEGGKAALAMKKKEWRREEKWRKMGNETKRNNMGGGMHFDFDPKDPKVISRTWKGIPDRWRASAWYSFLAASAKKNTNCLNDEDLIAIFHELQEEGSSDDVQIDCDVPRTINRHIMFRRRYRGGQRLLFRVLHALSLYFPATGYVQGMATLAATLLCYYDEEQAFIMMVRLWQLRGLDRLYASGFDGLMEALDEFEKKWLRGGEVAKKLEELDITSTAYGTRWYLTLFNYSIPFPAQLRVWDCFMLLGDITNASDLTNKFGADLDVLHATSAALVDATREILLDSDFENAMKVLTSWIPVKDEDLLMKVAHAEWKLRKKRT